MARFLRNLNLSCLLASLLALAVNGVAAANGMAHFSMAQPQDTVAMDTTGPLPFPFKDQPAFGTPSQDSTQIFLNKPSNINFEIEYDPETGQYIFYEKIGNLNYRLPQAMSLDDYINYDFEKSVKDYWRQRSRIHEMDQRGSLIPQLTIGGEAFNRVFGGNVVNIQPQGYVEVSFGYQVNKTENPAIPVRLQRVPTFDFDEKIQMNVMGQIGTKMNMRVNYNTEATFDYENKMNLEYTGDEDEIIKRIEAGNVSLPLNGSLITGASNLFGVKAEMQFGKLTLTTLFSQHKGETQTVETEGGAQVTTYEISAADYDANRHFFLSQYFRENYDNWLKNTAVPTSPISINKIEIWVTNKSNNFEESRNIIAFQDLGEHNPHIYNNLPQFQQSMGQPYPENIFPNNKANGLYDQMTTTYSDIRSTQNITAVMSQFGEDFTGGQDFEKIEQARKLSASEYTINERLGYISLNTALNSDEILAVAFSYTSNGKVFQVGEFSTDGIAAPQTLILKLLKGTNLSPGLPTWDLMMKNIYNLDAYQLTSEDFSLNVVYQNDSTGTYINYLPEGRLNGHILLEVMNLDKLNKQLDPYKDGVFDYIEGITVNSNRGRIIFPVLEPFGKHLADSIRDPMLAEKYTFQSLYDSTQVIAEQDAEHNKFRLVGSYKGASGSDISIGSLNLAQGSVKVTAGGRELTENVDYTVDYTLGRVKIINQALLEAGTPIQVSTESEDLFTMQRKTLLGTHANYAFSDNFNVGATALYMQERPLTQKVDYGEDPISNLMIGMDARYSTQSMLLTKAVDALPFYSTNTPSTIDVEAEVAKLIPGHSKVIEDSGNAYIDDFEGTKTSIDLKARQTWSLASTPQLQNNLFPEGNLTNQLEYGFNRAKLAYYIIDPLFLRNNSLTPGHIKNDPDQQSNHFVREVFEKEIFPAKESPVGQPTNIPVFDLAYYPEERGPYNYDTHPSAFSAGVNPDGTLAAPESRWGGIMRRIETNDFETSNIEFIEFWMMDPFVYDTLNQHNGGDLYFNLGEISEDILKDGRKSFEQGLPTSAEVANVDTTVWGRVSTLQSLVNAFVNDDEARRYQDIGLDGLSDDDEMLFYEDYLNQLRDLVYDDVFDRYYKDPSSDNFNYYRSSDFDRDEVSILDRYKNYNGPDGNSPTSEMSEESYPTAASTIPDVEDINSDNTLNEHERYYQYKVNIRKEDMQLGDNYITDIKESRVQLKNGQIGEVKWYQFKIPVRNPDDVFGNIRDFKSIRFLRMYLRGFEDPVILRFATLDLVRADWRRYTNHIGELDAVSPNATFDVSAVNIEENGSREPVNYVLPPGISRVIDPANPQMRQLNEQSMVLKVTDLEPGDARAAYKSLYMDFRRYKRLKLEVHAEEMADYPLDDDELHFFIRLGSDYNYNYYEYEVPLKLTPAGRYNGEIENDRYIVWPDENRLDIPLEIFTDLKLDRNAEMRMSGSTLGIQDIYEDVHRGWNKDKNRIKIKGSPNLGNVQVVMMGIRNKKGQLNTGPKSVEVWLNEMRLSDFDESGGWAANARATARLADLGSITVAGRARSAGFGSINQNVNSRSLDNLNEIDIATSLDLGRFFPEKAGVRLPMYYGYSRSVSTPKYNPLEPDIELDKSLERAETQQIRDSIKHMSQDLVTRKSLNFTNVRVEPKRQQTKTRVWDPENFSVSYSYNEIFKRNINTEYNLDKTYRGMFSYNYSSRPKLVEPLNKVKLLQKGPLKLIGDFNFYPLPTQISYRTDLSRRYHEIQARNITNPQFVLPATYEKDFLWNRYFDLRYDLTRSIKFDFSSRATSRIDEPEGRINRDMDEYEMLRDSILTNLWNLGRPTLYNHNVNVSYTLPINRIKMLSFITSTVRYQGTFDWQAGPITADTIRLGNRVQNSRNIQLTGNVNLQSLYNKVPYFQELNKKFRRTGGSRYSLNRQASSGRRQQEQETPERKVEKTYNGSIKITPNKPQTISHKLNTRKVRVLATREDGELVRGRTNIVDANTVEFIAAADSGQVQVTVKGVPGDQSLAKDILDLTTRMLIGVRTISVNYSINGGTVLPGYMPEPRLFGAGAYYPESDMFGRDMVGSFAPGFPFLAGWQDYNFARRAAEKGWITTDSTLNSPYVFTRNERFNLRTTIEPLPDLRIDLTADRSFSKNVSEFYNYDPSSGEFNANSFSETGNFSMSTLTWGTAFFAMGKGKVHQSEAFEKFKDYREIIAWRLAGRREPNGGIGYDPNAPNAEHPGYPDGYGPNSVEVMVPAFLAAYQGKDPNSVSLGLFPSIRFIRPNWRIQYEGMVSKIPGLNRIMKSLNFTHAYRSSYNVGSFITNLNYQEQSDGFSYVRDMANNFITPYDFNAVSISETFSPLINMDIMWQNDFTTRGEIKRSRNLTLSFANNQLTEVLSDEYTVGLGYRFTQMDLIIKTKNSQKAYSNDLNLRADLSYRKNKTVLRKIVENDDQITAGQSAFTIKTTADYMLSDRFQLRLFFDKVLNNPFTQLSFPTSNTNVGVSFRFTLAQ
ncbi:T9SS outer membrane translocon Sov/SprA [Mariniphaga anaerophila]|uniref:T9SS outer membrane translocon Sov/SprA n=1 Tax=Mariniphaga anaerophila TaxID=1484053 RepID=UPI001FE59F55|nr:cell surface protein SprA [Mariniphaga anaerophila]